MNSVLTILDIIGSIVDRVQKVSSSEQEAASLHERLTSVSLALEKMDADTSLSTISSVLDRLLLVTKDLNIFINKFSSSSILNKAIKLLKVGGYPGKLKSFNLELTDLLSHMNTWNGTEFNIGTNLLLRNDSLMGNDISKIQTTIDKLDRVVNGRGLITAKEVQYIKEVVVYKSKPVEIKYIKNIEIGETISDRGNSTIIYLAIYQDTKFAVKQFKDMPFSDPGSDANPKNSEILKEIKTLEKLHNSKYILQFLGCTSIDGYLGIISEYINNKTLAHWLYRAELPDKYEFKIKLGIARGLAYMHLKQIAHNDIKSANIMLTSDFSPRIIGLEISFKSLKRLGTAQWRAPEYWDLSDVVDVKIEFPFAADIYSFGVVLGEMYFKQEPWKSENENEIKTAVLHGNRPYLLEDAPIELHKMITDCWQQDPTHRITMSQVVHGLLPILE